MIKIMKKTLVLLIISILFNCTSALNKLPAEQRHSEEKRIEKQREELKNRKNAQKKAVKSIEEFNTNIDQSHTDTPTMQDSL